MRERPIIFSGPMVRAILDGRTTQTRRIAKKAVRHPDFGNIYTPGALVLEREPQHVIERACPFGPPRTGLILSHPASNWHRLAQFLAQKNPGEPLPAGNSPVPKSKLLNSNLR